MLDCGRGRCAFGFRAAGRRTHQTAAARPVSHVTACATVGSAAGAAAMAHAQHRALHGRRPQLATSRLPGRRRPHCLQWVWAGVGCLVATAVLHASSVEASSSVVPMTVHAQEGVEELIEQNLCAPVPACRRYDRHCHALRAPVSTLFDRYYVHSDFSLPPPPPEDMGSTAVGTAAPPAASDDGPRWLNGTEAQQLMEVVWANTTGYGGRGMSREYTYGEVLVEGIHTLFEALPLDPSSVVLDLGSGVGKFTVYTALTWNVTLSWGIEIVEHRYAKSAECMERVQEMAASVWHSPVRLSVMDFAALQHFGETTHIYMCSTCFGAELVDRILEVAAATPSVKYIISARALATNQLRDFAQLLSVRVPCSWSASTTFVVYCRGCQSAAALARGSTASLYGSLSSRMLRDDFATQAAASSAADRARRWNHLSSLVEEQRRGDTWRSGVNTAGTGGGTGGGAGSGDGSDGRAQAWLDHHRPREIGGAGGDEHKQSQLEQIVSQPWWTCSFLRRRALAQLFRQAFGCATRAAEFVAASREELLSSFPDLLEVHSFQYVFVWRPPTLCTLTPTPPAVVDDGDGAVDGGGAVEGEVDGDGAVERGVLPGGGAGAAAHEATQAPEADTAGQAGMVASADTPVVVRVLSKAEACYFLGESCDSEWDGPLTNPKDRGRAQLRSVATSNMIPIALSSAVRAGKFPTSPQDFVMDVRFLPVAAAAARPLTATPPVAGVSPAAAPPPQQHEHGDGAATSIPAGSSEPARNLGPDDADDARPTTDADARTMRFLDGHLRG